jgi:hypothetical protein
VFQASIEGDREDRVFLKTLTSKVWLLVEVFSGR